MNSKEQYFIIEKHDLYGLYATVNLTADSYETGISYHLSFTDPIKLYDAIQLKFVKFYPRNSVTADYHYWEKIVLSNRIKNLLQEMNIPGIDYIGAELIDRKGETHNEYSILHIRNRIACFNKEKSLWRPPAFDPNVVMSIKKMVLNMDKLEEIPLHNRLIFGLEECPSYILFHESVVDAIAAIEPSPTGFIFINIESWHADVGWELNT